MGQEQQHLEGDARQQQHNMITSSSLATSVTCSNTAGLSFLIPCAGSGATIRKGPETEIRVGTPNEIARRALPDCRWRLYHWSDPQHAVTISQRETCRLSETGCLANLLTWLPKLIEEKDCEVWKVYALVHSSLESVLSRMFISHYRPIYLLSVHFSR